MLVKSRLSDKPMDLVTVSPETPIPEMMKLMIEKKVGCLPVMDDKGTLVGIVDDKDIFRAVHKQNDGFGKVTAKDLMVKELLIGLPDDDINYIAGLMSKNSIRYVPIMEKGEMVGVISQGDVLKAQRRHIMIENRYLKLYMEGTHLG